MSKLSTVQQRDSEDPEESCCETPIHFEPLQINEGRGLLPGQPALAHTRKLYQQMLPPVRATWSQLGLICNALKGLVTVLTDPLDEQLQKSGLDPKSKHVYQVTLLSSSLPTAPCPSLIIILMLLLPKALNVKVAPLDSQGQNVQSSLQAAPHILTLSSQCDKGEFHLFKNYIGVQHTCFFCTFPAEGSHYNNIALHFFLA